MFEKEAEEEINKEHWKYSIFKDLAQEYWQKGAEFGYNKGFEFGVKSNEKVNQIVANEWHYVKDGDLPKNNNDGTTYLLYTIYGLGGSPVVAHFAYRDKQELMNVWTGAILTEDKIIAWKEIVLPKESE